MRRVLTLVFAVVLASWVGLAAPVCMPGTVADYVALGADGCQILDKVFFDFGYVGSGSGGAIAIPAAGVSVQPLMQAFNPGLIFVSAWSVGPGQTLDSAISYSVQVLPGGPPITDISASMAGFGHSANGIVLVAETTSVGNLLLFDNGGTRASEVLVLSDSTMGPIRLLKDISVNGNLGVATVSAVTNRFSEVPEPVSLVLIGSGLLGLGLLRRRIRRSV